MSGHVAVAHEHPDVPASAGVWIEVEEERLLVCSVNEILGVLEEIGICPYCEGKGPADGDSCPVCGRTAEPFGQE